MSCASSGAGSQQHQPSSTVALAMTAEQPREGGHCCSECNSQIWSSYVVGLLACLLVVGGIFLAFHRWDYLWLAVSAVGILLILIGASLHYCGGGAKTAPATAGDAGTRHQKRKRGSNHHRIVCELGNQNERLLPSAPPSGISSSGHNLSVSQLSLNGLPPFFQSYDTISLGTQVPSSPGVGSPVSPIMHLNGQSFLLLPIGGSSAETASEANSLAQRLSTHLALLEQQSFSQKRCSEAVNFGLVPCLTSFTAAKDQTEQTGLQVTFTPAGKTQQSEEAMPPPNQEQTSPAPTETSIAIPTEEEVQHEEEPIYQVPRIASTQATANVSQTDPNMCTAPVVEHLNLETTQSVAQVISTQAAVECPLSVDSTLSTNDETTPTTVTEEEEEQMPNQSNAPPDDDETRINMNQESVETATEPSAPVIVIVDGLSGRQEDGSVEEIASNNLTINLDSRVSTPEPNWTLPPSYEEVAPPSFKRLRHNKFAYETM